MSKINVNERALASKFSSLCFFLKSRKGSDKCSFMFYSKIGSHRNSGGGKLQYGCNIALSKIHKNPNFFRVAIGVAIGDLE